MFTSSHWGSIANFAGFIAALAVLSRVWLPRILAPRFAREMREDSARALALREVERRRERLGWILGLGFGTLGLILGIWLR
jgi:hypothetical protein